MGGDTPVISIIGTIYNQADLAERTLDIWCRQRFHLPYEIIVMDDGSTDGSREMIMEMDRKYPGLIRYYYFNEPGLIRNCTLLFNTAIRRLARAEIICVQWYDRIPSSFEALAHLYEPHLSAEKQLITFQHRHIAGSSSRDVIDAESLNNLMGMVDWRNDPMRLVDIMGEPGAHCYPEGMNESACFSFMKKDFLNINGYDERYFRVANYSNIELWGRFKQYGLSFTITDDLTFHQPHPANRAQIQVQIDPDEVVVRNTLIRQDFGQIRHEAEVPDDLCAWTVILPGGASVAAMDGVEVLQGDDVNSLMIRARGANILWCCGENVDWQSLLPEIEPVLSRDEIGCAGPCGGALDENMRWTWTGAGEAESACGAWLAFSRKPAVRNALRVADLGDIHLTQIDFCRQMLVWGGRRAYGFGHQKNAVFPTDALFLARWSFLAKEGCRTDRT